MYIDPDGNVGVTYEHLDIWTRIQYFGGRITNYRPHGWQYPNEKNGMSGEWYELRDSNRILRSFEELREW